MTEPANASLVLLADDGPRIPLLAPDEMSPEQRKLYDAVVSGPRGQMIGPLRAAIHSPELATLWSQFGEFLRYRTSLPPRLNELAIVVTGRRWTSQVEWWVHARACVNAGVSQPTIDAIGALRTPIFDEAADLEVYEFSRQLQQTGRVDAACYSAVERRWGTKGVVELVAVIGYYTMVSMTLNAHQLPLPPGATGLPHEMTLVTLLPGRMVQPVDSVPAPFATAPLQPLPDEACDAHSHIFGPFDLFPPLEKSTYPLPDAGPIEHAAIRRTLGITRGVLVQPAPYGDDPSAMLAAIAEAPENLRGVAVAQPDIDLAKLRRWREGGIVGLRFTEMRTPAGTRYPGSVGFDALLSLAPMMRKLGLHAQLWAKADDIAEWLPRLLQLGVPLVLDHLGCPEPSRGPGDPSFAAILKAMRTHGVWVKLTLCRVSREAPTYADVRPFHNALIETAPDKLIWGSDWPYVRLLPAPDAGHMADLLQSWMPDAGLVRRILVDNPARLYGF